VQVKKVNHSFIFQRSCFGMMEWDLIIYIKKDMLPIVFGIFAILLIAFIFFAIKKKNQGDNLGDRKAGDQQA